VLETGKKELEKDLALCIQLQLGLAHGTIRWCTGQCPVRQAGPSEKAALGTRRRRTAIIHRTVRWCTGLSGESSSVNSSPSGKAKGDVTKIHRTVRWCTELSGGEPECPVSQRSRAPTVGRAIFARRVAAPTGSKLQWSDAPDLKGDRAPDSYRDCPVHHLTEGKFGFPSWPPTAPSCLGAIKGTPRRMEELPKHSLSILRLQDSNFTHSILCDSDLSSI
jgi:hypothetical protein